MKLLAFFAALAMITGCSPKEEDQTVDSSLRWMDRKIYFASADVQDSGRNNIFQKAKVQEALLDLEKMTLLGEGYFSFEETDESSFSTTLDKEELATEQKSFILIWPDSVFNTYVNETLRSGMPDPNVITIINAANKRKFFIILKASCFQTSSSCGNIGVEGLKALVARQVGRILGLPIKDCSVSPLDVMCASRPSNEQWNSESKLRFSSALNNQLELIKATPDFYPK